MADSEAVIESVQRDAAQEVAASVAAEVAVDTAVVSGQVAEVSDDLADHAEVSEERHEEILAEQSWLTNQFQQLSANLTASQQATASLLTALQAQVSVLLQSQNPNPPPPNPNPPSLPDSTLSNPVEAVVVVEQPSAAEDGPENQNRSNPPEKRRKIRRI